MRLGILGAGSIGCYVGGRLVAGGGDVVLVGRERVRAEAMEHGLTLRDVDGAVTRVESSRLRFEVDVRALADADVVICTVKSAQTERAALELARTLAAGAVVISLQNGMGNAAVLARHLRACRVLAGIVSFNVVALGNGVYQQGTSGPLIVERSEDAGARDALRALRGSGLQVETPAELESHQWAKLMMNLGNAVSALSDAPTRDLILTPGYRRVLAALIGEALSVLRAAGIRPAKLRGVPVSWLVAALALPTPLVRLVARAQLRVNPDARSSMWEDLSRGRATEIDHLNGEIVRLAERAGIDAPLNRRIVALVHEVEARGTGSPALGPDELWAALGAA